MDKSMVKFLSVTIIIQMLIFPNVLSVNGVQPVIASRISEIIEITVITDPDYYKIDTTLFGIEVKVEILNRDDENQTVVELSDRFPKVNINATFVSQLLDIERIAASHDTVMYYSYLPGISVEGDFIMFYINQTGLTQLPDGNYTLWRPTNTASKFGYVDPAEVLLTNISVNADVMNIAYPNFTNITNYTIPENHNTNEVSFPLAISLVIISLITYTINIFKRRRTKI